MPGPATQPKDRRLRSVCQHIDPLSVQLRVVCGASATGTMTGEATDRIAEATELLDSLIADGTTSGACLAVSRRGGPPPIMYAAGHSGPSTSTAITGGLCGDMRLGLDSIFMTASITKPVTAAAVMLLVQEGKLALHDRVADHLIGFSAQDVRVHHILSHTSGLPDSWPGSHPLRKRRAPLAEYTREQLGVSLVFSPGTNVSYSSVAIDLAAAIVEKVADQPLSVFLHQRVFQPLGMVDSSVGHPSGAQWLVRRHSRQRTTRRSQQP